MGDITPYESKDMTLEERESLQNYKENGLPGIGVADDSNQFQWLNLYMAGKTYTEISDIVSVKKDIILFIADKYKWYEKRVKHYEDLVNNLIEKTTRAKLEGASAVSSIISALNKYYANKFNKYLSTNDDTIIEGLDPKILVQYYKSLETLDKLMASAKPVNPAEPGTTNPNSPIVNVNLGGNANLKQNEDGSLEISDNTAGKLLLELSKIKKESGDK